MSAGDVVRELTAMCDDALANAQRLLALADATTREHERVANALRGSRHPLVEQALAQQEGAVRRLREAAQHLARMAQGVAAYITVITGGPYAPAGVSAAGPPPEPASRVPTPRFDPVKAAEIRPLAGREKTIGRLYDAVGRPVGDLIYSGKDGPGAGGPGLTGRWKHLESLTEHTEGHAVAVMRRDQIKAAALYLNRYPCPGPDGCFDNIAAALPRGWRMTIWVVNANGSAVRVQRIGTGEAVER